MALPPPPFIVFPTATPWPSTAKPTPEVRAKRKPGDLVWRLHCPTCNADWAQSRRPSEGVYCAACFRSRKTKPRLLITWQGAGPMPAKRKPAALVWHTECSQCSNTWLNARRPKDTLYCGQCERAGRQHIPLKLTWRGPGPMPDRKS